MSDVNYDAVDLSRRQAAVRKPLDGAAGGDPTAHREGWPPGFNQSDSFSRPLRRRRRGPGRRETLRVVLMTKQLNLMGAPDGRRETLRVVLTNK